eukprot:TRINITY_DN10286_c0_g1_i2.p1 TRINITY_DN10286_c0_g1~~TRINITY_DN10286_c0_g1_i2.p1  ORF type:complete len:431 (+),score=53.11 TRINITY_DN10286_c0_g1_i2:53-1345(+)
MKALSLRKGSPALVIPAVAKSSMSFYQKSGYLKNKMTSEWPTSQRADRQQIMERVGVMQAGRGFDSDLYHHTYERYLGYKNSFEEVYKLVQKRHVHWTELLECKEILSNRTLMQVRNSLHQVGVDLSGSDIEAYTTWLVFIMSLSNQYKKDVKLQQQISNYIASEIELWDTCDDNEWVSIACGIAVVRSEIVEFKELLQNMIREQSLFSVRAFQLIVAPNACQYDVINGPAIIPELLQDYNDICKSSSTYAAAIHAALAYYARSNRSRSFIETVKCYQSLQTDIGHLPPKSIHLLFLFWMYNHKSLDDHTISVILKLFASWKLPDHVEAVVSEHKKSSQTPLLTPDEYNSLAMASDELQSISTAEEPLSPSAVGPDFGARERAVKVPKSRTRSKKIPREKVEAACVRELLQDAPFGGDMMIHKYIRIANM